MPRRGGPGDRRAAAVPPPGVEDGLAPDDGVLEAELLAGVQEDRPAHGEREDGGRPRPAHRAAVAAAVAAGVVAREHPGRHDPPGAEVLLDLGDPAPEGGGGKARVHGREVEGELQLVALAVVGRHLGGVEEEDLAEEERGPGRPVGVAAEAAQDLMGRGIVDLGGVGEGGRPGRGVGEAVGLAEGVGDVDPEAVHPAVQPEVEHLLHCLGDGGVGPVEVGLAREEEVEVPLPGRLVEGPRRAVPEGAPPVVGRPVRLGLVGVAPDVEVPVRARS